MPIEPVLCSQCGAPLQVPAGVQFVTCKQCGVGLRVRHEASVTYTEVIEKLARETEEISDHLASLRYEQALERIDREWERERQSLLVTNKRGVTYAPSKAAGVLAMVIGGVFGLGWTAIACGMTGAFAGAGGPMGMVAIFPIFGVVFTLLAIFLGITTMQKAAAYQRAETAYHERRAAAERVPGGQPSDG